MAKEPQQGSSAITSPSRPAVWTARSTRAQKGESSAGRARSPSMKAGRPSQSAKRSKWDSVAWITVKPLAARLRR